MATPRRIGSRSAAPADARSAFGTKRIRRADAARRACRRAGRAQCFRRAHQRAHVAGVLHASHQQHQRRAAQQIIERRGARLDQRRNALRRLCAGDVREQAIASCAARAPPSGIHCCKRSRCFAPDSLTSTAAISAPERSAVSTARAPSTPVNASAPSPPRAARNCLSHLLSRLVMISGAWLAARRPGVALMRRA